MYWILVVCIIPDTKLLSTLDISILHCREMASDDIRFPLVILFHDQGKLLLDLRFPLPLSFPVRDALDIRLTVIGYLTLSYQRVWTFDFHFYSDALSATTTSKFACNFSTNFLNRKSRFFKLLIQVAQR